MNGRAGGAVLMVGLGLVSAACEDDGVVPNRPPVAVIVNPGQDTAVISPYAVDFLGTASDGDGAVTSHAWNFGDGNTASVEDPGPYSYAAAGAYTVTYQVTDDDGAVSAPASVDIAVATPAIAPEPGMWFGRTEFSLLQFTLNAQGTAITEVVFILDTLPCTGGPSGTARLTRSSRTGWPVSGLQFTIEAQFPVQGLATTVQGTFASHTEASGTWTAVSSGTTCSGAWETGRAAPDITVWMNTSFTRTVGINGFNWIPGRAVALEIDNHADGTVDFDSTARPDLDGVARFNEGNPPFTVAEGDTIRMHDGRWRTGFVVLYLTLDGVDANANMIRGRARPGTWITAHVIDPSLPFPQGVDVSAIADATGSWTADFTGVFDILSSTRCLVSATCSGLFGGMVCGGKTGIQW